LKLIVDYKHQDYKQPAFGKEAAFRAKILTKGDGQY
jgi:hypothetical protein